jgi:hypothetical protein
MLWRRAAYQMIGGHAALHTKVAEDIAMARRVAALGLCGRLLPGSEHVFCRMYRTTGEVLQGLGENLYTVGGLLLGRAGPWVPGALSALLIVRLVYYTWSRVRKPSLRLTLKKRRRDNTT